MKKLITIDEAVNLLRISKPTLYRFTSGKKIPFYKIGNHVVFDEDTLNNWLKGKAVIPEGEPDGR